MKNNKRKLAVISLVVMMMITAVGYAAFSDDLKVIGTAQNARFDVQFVSAEDGAYVDELASDAIMLRHGGPGGGHHDGDNDNPDVISVKVTNLIPGQSEDATGTIKNFGTVYAVLDDEDGIIEKDTPHYHMTLVLPKVLGYKPEDCTDDFTLTVLMKDYTVTDGIAAAAISDTTNIEFSYKQQ